MKQASGVTINLFSGFPPRVPDPARETEAVQVDLVGPAERKDHLLGFVPQRQPHLSQLDGDGSDGLREFKKKIKSTNVFILKSHTLNRLVF